ncbi:hypothetical protein GCM10009616_25310 [Microlunatus lacustris]
MPPGSTTRIAAPSGLVAVLTLLTLELVRFSGPLLDSTYGRGGPVVVAAIAVLTYSAPGPMAALLLATMRRSARPWVGAVLLGTALLGLLRLTVQGLQGDARVVVGLVAVAVSVAVLVLAVSALVARPGGGRTAAGAVLSGAAASVGLQLVLGTWDAPWRQSVLGWSVAVVLVALSVLLGVQVRRGGSTGPGRPVRSLWVLGPALALGAMMLANPAFAAAQSGLPLAAAGPVLGVGLLLGAALVTRRPVVRRPSAGAAAAMLVVATAVALQVPGTSALAGALVLAALVTAQLSAALLVARAWSPSGDLRRARPSRALVTTAGTACVVGLATIGPLLLFQLDYDVPLGFPNAVVVVVTAAAVAAAGLRRAGGGASTSDGPLGGRGEVLLGAGALLLLGTGLALDPWSPDRDVEDPAYTGRLVSWNLHYGVAPGGQVDLAAVARVIETQDPDVVLLQEVSRGWIQGGGVDMASWLAHRLDRSFVFAPAADGRFGNVILARGGLAEVRVLPLPFGAGPQRRSALTAVTRLGSEPAAVTSLHLQHRSRNTPTRLAQLDTFLASATAPVQVVGGDLNAQPGSPEVRRLTGEGYVSAVDAIGDPGALTAPSTAPTRRIDWVFGRGTSFRSADVLAVVASDHLPLVVAVDR